MADYKLINYFDTWYTGNEGWDVNNLCEEEGEITLHSGSKDEIIDQLKKHDFLQNTVTSDMIEVWNDYEMIEFFVAETGEPLGRLELIRD